MRTLVCGGRNYAKRSTLFRVLDELDPPPTLIISGGCPTGADMLAERWAYERGCPVEQHNADWHLHGRSAGPRRNTQMLAEGCPDRVIAFPGGPGTKDIVRKARHALVPVTEVAA